MSDVDKQGKPTIWTGAATTLPVLAELDLTRARSRGAPAKRHVVRLHARIKQGLAPFVVRSTADSLRKQVK